MATLADVRTAADGEVREGWDDTCPVGTFYAAGRVVGIMSHHLLAGEIGSEEAEVLGRLECGNDGVNCYKGSGIKGGEWFSYRHPYRAFRKMAEAQ